MGKKLRVLIVEDSEDDTLLVMRELKRGGYELVFERVDTAEAMREALANKTWDIVISDYVMPQFSGLEALRLLQRSGLDLPFIIVSGKIGEDVAVEAMRAGAYDYIMKDNLAKLVPAVERELREVQVRREKKQAEERIRFQTIVLSQVNDAVIAIDNNHHIIYWNNAAERLYNFKSEEVLGKPVEEVTRYRWLKPEDERAAYDSLAKTGSWRGENIHIKKSGEEIYVESLVSVIYDEKGIEIGLLTVTRDITERKRMEDALRRAKEELEIRVRERTAELERTNETLQTEIQERKRIEKSLRISEAKCRSIFEHIVEGLFNTTLDGRFITVNPSLAHILGYESPQEFLSKITNVKQLYVDPGHRDELVHLVQKQGIVTGFEAELRRKDGNIIWVSLNIRALHDSSGKVTALEGTLLDITERKQSEELSKALYDINLTINSTLDFDEIMRRVVVEAAKAIGSDACNITLCEGEHWVVEYAYGLPQEIIGIVFSGEQAAISDLVEETKQPIAIKDLLSDERFRYWMLKEYGIRSVLGIPLFMRKEVIGVLYFGYFSAKPSFSQAEIEFAEKLSTSVSLAIQNARLFEERKQAEEELRQRTAELARSNAELEQFAYVASHDLQEPLRMISGFIQLLKRRYKGKLDKDADEFITYIVDGTTRMQKMIEDLLAYSRVGKHGKPFEPANLEDILNQSMVNLKTAIEENSAQITHDPLPTVMADATQMVQLFQNLIANAIKFRKREEPPRIHVGAQRKGNEWVFSVKDNGIGIAPEFMGHLFQLFAREHAAGEYPGTGIGLAVCKRIVDRHGGRIWAESELGKGSTFYFTIPMRR